MIYLNEKIVAYLYVNQIEYNSSDYTTMEIDGVDQITYWDTEALGAQPTEAQLDEAYPVWEGQQIAAENKAQAEQLLQATDWTATVDISNPQYSNPYLGNQDAFIAYRSQVRAIAVNPPTTPATFQEVPQEVWITT